MVEVTTIYIEGDQTGATATQGCTPDLISGVSKVILKSLVMQFPHPWEGSIIISTGLDKNKNTNINKFITHAPGAQFSYTGTQSIACKSENNYESSKKLLIAHNIQLAVYKNPIDLFTDMSLQFTFRPLITPDALLLSNGTVGKLCAKAAQFATKSDDNQTHVGYIKLKEDYYYFETNASTDFNIYTPFWDDELTQMHATNGDAPIYALNNNNDGGHEIFKHPIALYNITNPYVLPDNYFKGGRTFNYQAHIMVESS